MAKAASAPDSMPSAPGSDAKKLKFPTAFTVLAAVPALVWVASLFVPAGGPIPSSHGMWQETLGFFVLLVSLTLALGHDRLLAALAPPHRARCRRSRSAPTHCLS
jgi:hypothetical protein